MQIRGCKNRRAPVMSGLKQKSVEEASGGGALLKRLKLDKQKDRYFVATKMCGGVEHATR